MSNSHSAEVKPTTRETAPDPLLSDIDENKPLQKRSAKWWVRQMHDNWNKSFDPVIEVSTRIYRLHELLRQNIDAVLAGHGLQSAEFEVLSTLRIVDPPHELTPTELYRTILLSSGGMTKVIKRLEAAGLVDLSSSPSDRRSKIIRLNSTGKKLIEAVMRSAIDAEVEVLEKAFPGRSLERTALMLDAGLERLEKES